MMKNDSNAQIMCRDRSRDFSCGSRFSVVSDHVIKMFRIVLDGSWKLEAATKLPRTIEKSDSRFRL